MPSTSRGYPYPDLSYANNPPADIQALAVAVDDDVTFLKSGVAAATFLMAAPAATSTGVELVLATAPAITFDGSTMIEISWQWYNATKNVGTDIFIMRIYDGPTVGSGTLLDSFYIPSGGVFAGGGMLVACDTPSAGAHTYTARVIRSSGTGYLLLGVPLSGARVGTISVKQAN